MVGGWSRRRASLFFPFLLSSLLRVSPRLPFASTSCLTNPTPSPTAAALRGRYNHAPASALSPAYHDMFGNGLQHRLAQQEQQQQQKPAPPPPPPPKQSQISITSFQTKAPSRYNAPPSKRPSHGPSLSTVINRSNPLAQRTNSSQGLKPRETVSRAFSSVSSSFTESAYQSQSSASSWGSKPQTQLSALHQAVFFDEGDFEDDGDLNFDDSITQESPGYSFGTSPASFSVPSPPLPRVSPSLHKSSRESTPNKRAYDSISDEPQNKSNSLRPTIPNSSAPLPWSSSPVEHLGPPTRPSSRVPIEMVDLTEEADVPKKKRKIPWAGKTEAAAAAPKLLSTFKAPSASTKAPPKRPNPAPDNQLPWDMTASDLKKASRKKAEQKRAMSTAAGSEGEKKKVLKQKKMQLSAEQMHVLDLVLESGKSVFFTGSAGTGKSVLMREVIHSLRDKWARKSGAVAVTASTGLAACNVGGVTLHSFAGIGLGKEAVPDLVKKIKKNIKAKTRWLNTKVLVIDEISMVDGELFDKLEAIARTIKNNGRPFGGIQLVVTGDFFQLPPVPDYGKVAKFAFDADSWNTTIEHTIGLTQVFRQKDPEFASILNEMRLGFLSAPSEAVFRRLARPIAYDDGLEPTELFPTRQEVDAANNSKMRVLTGKSETYRAEDSGTITDRGHRDKLLSNCMAPAVIELKINSQVMLIKNVDDGLVNGSLGRIVGFMNEKTFDLVQDDPEAWNAALKYDEEGEEIPKNYKRIQELARASSEGKTTARLWPLVEFVLPDGTSRQLLVQPEQWKVELPSGEVQACRTQIPLILAWALSIHKAQGQTLERVKVDLGKVFEKGQAYVALSRATCQEGLQVLRFDAKKVMAHEKVREFYKSLYSAAEAKKKREEYPDEDEDEEMMMRG